MQVVMSPSIRLQRWERSSNQQTHVLLKVIGMLFEVVSKVVETAVSPFLILSGSWIV